MIRKATAADLPAVERLYEEIHDAKEAGLIPVIWRRGVYPSRATALAALERDDLFVLERLDRLARNARGFLEVGKVLQALKCYETMVLIRPDAANVRAFGTCLKRIGKLDLAEKVLKRADELESAARRKSVSDLAPVGHDENSPSIRQATGKES